MAVNLASGVVLKLEFKPGSVLEYRVTTRMKQEVKKGGEMLGQQSYTWTSSQVQKVLASEADGSGHLLTISQPQGDTQEVSGLPLARSVIYTQMTPQGDIKETTGPDSGAAFSFPAEAVKEGGEWTGNVRISLPGVPKPLEAVTKYKLAGTQEVAGYSCVKIELSSPETTMDLPVDAPGVSASLSVSSKGALYFEPIKGILVRQEVSTVSIPSIADATYETSTELEQELVRTDGL